MSGLALPGELYKYQSLPEPTEGVATDRKFNPALRPAVSRGVFFSYGRSGDGKLHGITLQSQSIKPEVISAQPAINRTDAMICALDLYGTFIPIIKLITIKAKPTAVTLSPPT